jgi:hypothetical protein
MSELEFVPLQLIDDIETALAQEFESIVGSWVMRDPFSLRVHVFIAEANNTVFVEIPLKPILNIICTMDGWVTDYINPYIESIKKLVNETRNNRTSRRILSKSLNSSSKR